MNTEALKEQARRHEQREEWQKALDLYGQAVDRLAEDDQPDLALYNRLGDLEIRVGNIERAIEHYEQAIDLYLESELPNNAIAICRKIVRNLPTRHHIYLKMGQIRARQGFLTDARQNFLEYAERMQKAEDMEEAFRALIEFVELAPDDMEARSALASQLAAHDRTAEAVEQYVAVHQQLSLAGRDDAAADVEAKIRELDASAEIPPPHSDDDDVMGFETTSLVADFPVFETEAAVEEEVVGVEAQFGEIQVAPEDDAEAPDASAFTDEGEGEHEELDLEYTVATGSFAAVDSESDEEEASDAVGDGPSELALTADEEQLPEVETLDGLERNLGFVAEEADASVLEPTAELLFGETADTDDAGDDLKIAPGASWEDEWGEDETAVAETPGAEDLLTEVGEEEELELEELPLLTFDDEPAAAGDADQLGAGDFGVRDDEWRDDEYVAVPEELPELEAGLAELEVEGVASEDEDVGEADLPGLEVEEESPLEQALREEETTPEEASELPAEQVAEEPAAREVLTEDAPAAEVFPADDASAAEEDLTDDARAVEEFLAEEERILEEALREGEPIAAFDDGADQVAALQERLEKDPDDAETWLALAQEFYALDRNTEAGMALEQALDGFRSLDDLDGSIRAVQMLVWNQPDRVQHHQRLVELAIRRNDLEVLTPAYLGLAACLVRAGDQARAQGVYEQVLVSDPENLDALDGLEALSASRAAPVREVASSEDYVDLGSMVLDVEEERTTRWKVPAAEPSGDEEADFAQMLSQFKEKVAEHLEADDLAAHYDLGTAYKEMGLVDEAISEFQQALRAQADHLPTHELLGQCFMETGQYEVAVRSMNRAVDAGELGNKDEALEFYEKVFALDINFQDVTERLRVLR
jgi:tetratricopeptide (TPR) repeat protein